MKFKYNQDEKTRNIYLYGKATAGDAERFAGLTLENLKKLLDEKFIDPEVNQNHSPTTEQFLEFMTEFPQVTAHGYAISKDRDDYRVTIEGIECTTDINITLMGRFGELCNGADELTFNENHLYSWWD